MSVSQSEIAPVTGNCLEFCGLRVQALLDGLRYGGLSHVTAGDVELRSAARPILPLLESPSGSRSAWLEVIDSEAGSEGEYRWTFHPAWEDVSHMEWMLHETRPRRATRNWAASPELDTTTTLAIELAPREYRIGSHTWRGFAYRYHYNSESLATYQLLDRATWEIGGSACGNSVYTRIGKAKPVTTFESPAEHYSTEWYLPDVVNPNIFQFHPLQTQLQGFTFTAHDAGVLVTRSPDLAHIRTLLEKPAGDDVISHWHELCTDLSRDWMTPWMEVLWLPGLQSKADRWNRYYDVFEDTADILHKQAGLRRERVQTYCSIEQWNDADLADYRERGLKAIADAKLKWVRLANHFGNNMNVYGVENMCCTTDLSVPPSVGEDQLRAFCETAHANDIRVEMWGNTAVSTLAWMLGRPNGVPKLPADAAPKSGTIAALRAADDPFVLNPAGAPDADHYSPVFAVMNIRDATVQKHWLNQWRHAHDEIGLDGIFLDSSFNLTSDKFHWRPNPDTQRTALATDHDPGQLTPRPTDHEEHAEIQTMYHAHLALVARMQEQGYRYCGEDVGVFGVHSSGPPVTRRLDNMPMWQDCFARFDPPATRRAGADPDAIYFQGLAFRTMWILSWLPATDELSFASSAGDADMLPTEWHLQLMRTFDQLEPRMRSGRRIEEGLGAVAYENDGSIVAWVFEDGGWTAPEGMAAVDVLTGQKLAATDATRKHRVYVAEPE